MRKDRFLFLRDVGVVALSVLVAVLLVRTHVMANLLTTTQEREWIGSFVAGLFFTTIFTTAPAMATLGEIAQANSIWSTAAFGAAGAVIGDLLIFRFMKDQVAEHLSYLLKHKRRKKRFFAAFRYPAFRWLTFLMGGLIIASPLPDELGISMMGLSRMKTAVFIPISYGFNFLGIVLIGLVAKSL